MSYALELKGIRKNFGQTEIIRGVDLKIPQGQRHGRPSFHAVQVDRFRAVRFDHRCRGWEYSGR